MTAGDLLIEPVAPNQVGTTSRISMKEMAAFYARVMPGFVPFPVCQNMRKPYITGWQSVSLEQVVSVFNMKPSLNIALAVPDGFMVLDIDQKNGKDGYSTLAGLEALHGTLPETLTQRTPSGGEHRVFKLPDGVAVKNNVGVASGLDIRSKGGLIVCEPSCIDGKAYAWIDFSPEEGEVPSVAVAPNWLVDLCGAKKTVPADAPAMSENLKLVQGDRNFSLFKKASTLRGQGFDTIEIEAALLRMNSRVCVPPLGADEVSGIARSAGKYAPNPEISKRRTQGNQGVKMQEDGEIEAVEVSVADVLDAAPPPPEFVIGEIVPAGVVTLLGANGGTGKSMLALMAAVCVATGLPFLGKPTRQGKVLFYSAEDARDHLRHRMAMICRHLGVNPRDVAQNLTVLDVTDSDPALYCEVNEKGVKRGTTTRSYEKLKTYVEDRAVAFLVIDNASDTFDANEIERARVRGFIRSLAQLVKLRGGAVLLLSHVDKQAAGGQRTTQGYSGSTAWNNSVRSRLFMAESGDGVLLEHQKSNLGKKAAPMNLLWTGGVLTYGGDLAAQGDAVLDQASIVAVLRLIDEFNGRGEFISTASTSPDNAYKKLAQQKGYPKKLTKTLLTNAMRDAERGGLLYREEYQTKERKSKERWALTSAGRESLAPTAPTCADSA